MCCFCLIYQVLAVWKEIAFLVNDATLCRKSALNSISEKTVRYIASNDCQVQTITKVMTMSLFHLLYFSTEFKETVFKFSPTNEMSSFHPLRGIKMQKSGHHAMKFNAL